MNVHWNYLYHIALPMIILGIIGIVFMVLTSAYIWLISTFIFWILLSGLGIAVGYHRVYSHRTFVLKPWLDKIVLFCGALGCQGSSITWVSIHMGYHHPYADREEDFHTPRKGLWNAFLGWTLKVTPDTINHRYAVKLIKDKTHLNFHKYYLFIVWGFVVLSLLLFGWKFTLFGYCIAAFISIIQDNLVNVLGHCPRLGYRNFDTDDISSNFYLLGYLGWGQGWHNNHHKYPARFDFGVKWWEWDPCKIFLPLLKFGSISKSR